MILLFYVSNIFSVKFQIREVYSCVVYPFIFLSSFKIKTHVYIMYYYVTVFCFCCLIDKYNCETKKKKTFVTSVSWTLENLIHFSSIYKVRSRFHSDDTILKIDQFTFSSCHTIFPSLWLHIEVSIVLCLTMWCY